MMRREQKFSLNITVVVLSSSEEVQELFVGEKSSRRGKVILFNLIFSNMKTGLIKGF